MLNMVCNIKHIVDQRILFWLNWIRYQLRNKSKRNSYRSRALLKLGVSKIIYMIYVAKSEGKPVHNNF